MSDVMWKHLTDDGYMEFEPCNFTSVGGGIHHSAIIGQKPQHRDWAPGDPIYGPRVHPTARVEAYVTIDCGMERHTVVGANVKLLKQVHVGHDVLIGHDCEFAPMTTVGGFVIFGPGVRVSQACSFRPYVEVGAGARIGMGAVVTRNVPAGETWVGVPAHRIDDDALRGLSESELESLLGWAA